MGLAVAPRGASLRGARPASGGSASAAQRGVAATPQPCPRPPPPAGRAAAAPGGAGAPIRGAGRRRGVSAAAGPSRPVRDGQRKRSPADADDTADAVLQGAEAVCLLGALGVLVRAPRGRSAGAAGCARHKAARTAQEGLRTQALPSACRRAEKTC